MTKRQDDKKSSLPAEKNWDEVSHTHPITVVPLETDEQQVVPCLIVISGQQMGQVFRITGRKAQVGRMEEADLRIRDTSISRHHAMIYLDSNERCRIRDLGSTNGTFVNGRRIQDVELTAGDRVQLGKHTILKLEYHGKFEEEFHAQLYEAGTRDPLTNTFNRRYLEQHLEADFRLAIRHKEELSLLIIDIDEFKAVNDTYGHLAGDAVLRAVATLLGSRVRQEDILARYGGEEFVVILRRTSTDGALSLGEALRKLVANSKFSHKKHVIQVQISVGVATMTHPPQFDDPHELIAAADDGLYMAKQQGKNRVVLKDPKAE